MLICLAALKINYSCGIVSNSELIKSAKAVVDTKIRTEV
jgi:hypothetical protein